MSDTTVPATKPFLSNTTYDRLKWVALVGLPALGTLYFLLAGIWHLPKAEEVVGTIVAIDGALGTLLGLAKKNYDSSDAKFDGVMNVLETDNKLINKLEITTPPEEAAQKQSITLKVNQVPPE